MIKTKPLTEDHVIGRFRVHLERDGTTGFAIRVYLRDQVGLDEVALIRGEDKNGKFFLYTEAAVDLGRGTHGEVESEGPRPHVLVKSLQ